MRTTLIRPVRRTIGIVLIALLLFIGGLVGFEALASRLGYGVLTIRGASMAPAIPLGSLVAIDHPDTDTLVVGDVISIQSSTGVVYTHRIAAIDTTGAERQFQIRGDANLTLAKLRAGQKVTIVARASETESKLAAVKKSATQMVVSS